MSETNCSKTKQNPLNGRYCNRSKFSRVYRFFLVSPRHAKGREFGTGQLMFSSVNCFVKQKIVNSTLINNSAFKFLQNKIILSYPLLELLYLQINTQFELDLDTAHAISFQHDINYISQQ